MRRTCFVLAEGRRREAQEDLLQIDRHRKVAATILVRIAPMDLLHVVRDPQQGRHILALAAILVEDLACRHRNPLSSIPIDDTASKRPHL